MITFSVGHKNKSLPCLFADSTVTFPKWTLTVLRDLIILCKKAETAGLEYYFLSTSKSFSTPVGMIAQQYHTQQAGSRLKDRLQLEMGMWQHQPGGESPEV